MKKEILKSIGKPEEQLTVSKAVDSAFLCKKINAPIFSDFLDPKSVHLIRHVLSHHFKEVDISAFGGCEGCERVILCFRPIEVARAEELSDGHPDGYPGGHPDGYPGGYPIRTLFIDSSKFSSSLTHRDFLGAMIGLGIDRSKLGDIFVEDGNAVVFVHENIAEFLLFTLERIGRVKVRVSEYEGEFRPLAQEGKIKKATVPSMRADAVVGEAFGLSRAKSSELIKSEKLFVNWGIMSHPSTELKEGDVISARGFGRAVIRNIGGKTKKDRIFIELECF